MRAHSPIALLTAITLLTAVLLAAGCDKDSSDGDKDVVSGDVNPTACEASDPCGETNYSSDLPDGTTIYVNSCCAAEAPDGSLESPYPTVGAAVEAAPDASVIAVARGTYTENIDTAKSLQIIGAGMTSTLLSSIVAAKPTIKFHGAADVLVKGLTLAGDGEIGVRADETASITLLDLKATGYSKYGIMIYSSNGKMEGCVVTGNGADLSTAGVLVASLSDFAVGSKIAANPGDLATGGCQISTNIGFGVLAGSSKIKVLGNLLEDNQGGAVYLHRCRGPEGTNQISGNEVVPDIYLGIGIDASDVLISGNTVSGTVGCSGTNNCLSDCIYVWNTEDEIAQTTVEDNLLTGCPRTGVLLSENVSAKLIGNTFEGVGFACVWVQLGADLELMSNNQLQDCEFAGIEISLNSQAAVVDNEVNVVGWGTFQEFKTGIDVDAADGIVVNKIKDSSLTVYIEGNTITSSQRVGILVDGSDHTVVEFGQGNVVAGSQEGGIALQNGAEAIAEEQDLEALVTFDKEGFEPNLGAGDLALGTEFDVVDELEGFGVKMCIPPRCTD